jgi:hypothetical protein
MYKVYIFIKTKKELDKIEGSSKKALIRLIRKSANKKWFYSHKKTCRNTDLIYLKQDQTAERIGGFIINDNFYIAKVFAKHQIYENKIRDSKISDFPIEKFILYKRDKKKKNKMKKIINENKNLRKKISLLEYNVIELNKSIDEKDQIEELKEANILLINKNKQLETRIKKLKYGKKINKRK